MSKNDIRRCIKIPDKLTHDLAEIIGIVVGDGHVRIGNDGYRINISGHSLDDKQYFENHVIPLFWKVFNLKPHIKINGNEFDLVFSSKAATLFFRNDLNFPANKNLITVPTVIENAPLAMKARFLRGFMDTDFSVMFKRKYREFHYYPIINGASVSKDLMLSISKMFTRFNIPNYLYHRSYIDKRSNKKAEIHHIYVSGIAGLNDVIRMIGFSNPKHLTKIEIWKKYGFYPPLITAKDRDDIIKGIKDPRIFYGPGRI